MNHDLPTAQATLQAIMPREQKPRTMAERDIALAWGKLMLEQGEPGMALQIAEHLLASAPGLVPGQSSQPIPYLLKLKGEALMALSHLDEAVEALEDARRGAVARNARPVLWTIHRSLGRAYQLLQRKEQARQERAAGRQLIEELATTIYDASLRDQFERAALDSFPQEKPLLSREAARHAFGGLTAREREVAALIAQGKTSREFDYTLFQKKQSYAIAFMSSDTYVLYGVAPSLETTSTHWSKKRGAKMTILHIEHPIRDFDTWKKAFESDPAGRERGGVRRYQVLRPIDDQNYVMIDLDFDSSKAAEAFLAAMREVWRSPAAAPALSGSPQTRIIEVVESKEY